MINIKSIREMFANLVAAVALVACSPAPAQELNYPQGFANCTVELNGDSVLFGFVNDPSKGWRLDTTPAQWLRNRGYTINDRTAGGLRTYDLLRGYLKPFPEAWPELYPNGAQPAFWNIAHDSRIVVIQTGINDFKDPFNPAQVYQDYAYMVDYIRAQGKIPVLTGVIQLSPALDATMLNRVQQIRTKIKQVATDKFVHYASFENVPVWYTDGIHLNQASSNGMTENLRYVLSVICGVPF